MEIKVCHPFPFTLQQAKSSKYTTGLLDYDLVRSSDFSFDSLQGILAIVVVLYQFMMHLSFHFDLNCFKSLYVVLLARIGRYSSCFQGNSSCTSSLSSAFERKHSYHVCKLRLVA